jgi:4-amino-4-deoxychorismate lyase
VTKFLETLRLEDGMIHHLHYHQLRVCSVFDSFGMVCKIDLASYFNTLKRLPKKGLLRVRFIYTLEGIVTCSFHPYVKREIKHLKLVENDTIEYDKKYLSRAPLDTLFHKRQGCHDVLIIKNGYVSDTTIANVAFYDGVQWFTPATPLLEGTTRKRYLENGTVFAREIRKEDIYKYQKIALMNAMIGFDIIEKNIEECIC